MAIGLRRAGHQVTVATHENFASFVRQFDLKFVPIAGNMEEFLQSKLLQRLIAGEKLKKEEADKLLLQQLESAWSACVGSEVIIYTPLANWGYHIAEKLGVPCFFASVLPLTPTGMFGFLRFAQIAKNPLKKAINYGSYLLVEFLHWQKYRPLLNHFRTETLKLPPLPYLGRRFRQETPAKNNSQFAIRNSQFAIKYRKYFNYLFILWKSLKSIPALALSAYAGEINSKQAVEAGFQRHISKQIDPEILVQTIVALIACT